MADEGLGQVEKFRAGGRNSGIGPTGASYVPCPKGALALALGGETGPA